MGNRESDAVYRRRRAVVLIIVLLPVAVILRACAVSEAPTPLPQTIASVSETPTVTTQPKATPTASATTSAKASTAAPKIAACANHDILVSVTTDAEFYAIGTPVTMAMRISNKGTVECKRDIGSVSNEVYVTDADGAVVWSSDACQVNPKAQVVVMRPGAVFGIAQVWGGSISGRDCTQAAADATPGSYLAYARNDTVVSKVFAFTIQ